MIIIEVPTSKDCWEESMRQYNSLAHSNQSIKSSHYFIIQFCPHNDVNIYYFTSLVFTEHLLCSRCWRSLVTKEPLDTEKKGSQNWALRKGWGTLSQGPQRPEHQERCTKEEKSAVTWGPQMAPGFCNLEFPGQQVEAEARPRLIWEASGVGVETKFWCEGERENGEVAGGKCRIKEIFVKTFFKTWDIVACYFQKVGIIQYRGRHWWLRKEGCRVSWKGLVLIGAQNLHPL